MALITRSGQQGMDAYYAQVVPRPYPLPVGEDLTAIAPVYIKSSTGTVFMSEASAADEEAEFIGITPKAYRAGEPCTPYGLGTIIRLVDSWAAISVNPGDLIYIDSANPGEWNTAATTGDQNGTLMALPEYGNIAGNAMVIRPPMRA